MTEPWQDSYDNWKLASPDDEDAERDYREREADRECDER